MMPKFSLKRSYQIYGLIFLAVTLAINSIIPLCMMCTGMFSMHEITLHNAGQAAEAVFTQGSTELDTDNISVFADWQRVPDKIKAINDFQPPTAETGIRYQHLDGPYIDALSVHYTASGQPLYLWLHYDATHDLVFAPKNMTAILLLIVMTFGVVASLAFHMQKQVITPVHKISQAIKQHDWQSMNGFSFPKQGYAELQSIVDALNTSLQQLQKAQQRELNFLRFASHELRTPVAICQSSFELLTLQKGKLTGPVLAASQATAQMKSIIETLLWLTNKSSTQLEKQPLMPAELLQQLAAEQEHAQGKQGVIQLDCDDTQLQVLKEPLSIMLNNLLRNALEHGTGEVKVEQRGKRIRVSNSTLQDSLGGFGLGLMLVKRLAKQLGWQFKEYRTPQMFIAEIEITD